MVDLAGLRIAFLAGTLGQGGAERQLYYMLATLREAGACPRVLSLTQGEYWQPRIESIGVPVHWVGQTASGLARLTRIVQELKRNPASIFQSQHFFANGYVVAASRLLGLTEIGAVRGDGFEELESNPGVFGWCSLRLPRHLAANSTVAIENAVSELGAKRERFFFVPNVVDAAAFSVPPRVPGERIVVLAAGSLVPVKRLDRMLRSLLAVRARAGPDVQAVIVGDGPMRPQLESLASELGLAFPQLQFRGSTSDIIDWYRKADMLVLTSDREGTPNVILEAMASGLPVVATRVGGVPALVKHGVTGYLVDTDDEASLAASILDLVEDTEKRLEFGAQGRKFVQQHHDLPMLAPALRRAYGGILANGNARDSE